MILKVTIDDQTLPIEVSASFIEEAEVKLANGSRPKTGGPSGEEHDIQLGDGIWQEMDKSSI